MTGFCGCHHIVQVHKKKLISYVPCLKVRFLFSGGILFHAGVKDVEML